MFRKKKQKQLSAQREKKWLLFIPKRMEFWKHSDERKQFFPEHRTSSYCRKSRETKIENEYKDIEFAMEMLIVTYNEKQFNGHIAIVRKWSKNLIFIDFIVAFPI